MKIRGSLLIVLMFISGIVFSQKKTNYEVGVSSAVGANNSLPFWLHSNKNGIIPEHGFVMTDLSLGMDIEEDQNESFDFMWKASGLGYVGNESKLIVNQLYAGIRWKFINFYLGQKSHGQKYDGLSSTNGDLLYSNNSRAYPQYELSVPDYTNVPYTNGYIAIKGLLSDGITTDDRYIDNTRIHHKNLYVRLFKDSKISVSGGIEHYALWSGTHPVNGDISGSLHKYFKVFRGTGDDDGAYENDAYRIGNHIGSYRFDVYFNAKSFSLNSFYQTIFEDGSGRKSENSPDGLFGLYYERKNKDKSLFQAAIVEFYHTTDQSGALHGDIDGVHYRGVDNYFNHGEYRSGWTHYGRSIGSPLFTNGEDKELAGVENNRFKAVHFGVAGFIGEIPYKTYLTFSNNFGTYSNPYSTSLSQFSGLVEVRIPAKKIPFNIDLACALDEGELLKDKLGFFIRISKSGLLKRTIH
ncbi:hypothetical protein BZG02_06075 [Labilibaculum filiforme]|uniref:Capsule assembly Wzi family protein n=1 Tax=Labilibaculum filiforme TaxID=1940526 RepID=A0A2N3I251_9BACT|nr:capsule assembly Wzi family protein [Labilibaculum filiforme]PKQ64381.1 hypothetical protein BZG02_06075 [Labilibaculum filiforme]